ncbi:MAG: hypothetical protein BMS9Abin31_0131 [Gammaproteobacteria bacterium]|nr:MAG: hypothetical protein BMS9Abin31_0131 [Gammaproteobacteria bacterium]
MDFKHIYTPLKCHKFLLACLINLAISSSSFAISNTEIKILEKDFQQVTNQFYSSLAKNLHECRSRFHSLKSLNSQLNILAKENKDVIGICLIQSHMPLIEENIDSKEVFPVFQFLLNNNNLLIANRLYAKAKSDGDQSLLSNISFIYARYYLKRKKWKKVLKYIKGSYNNLTAEDGNLARLFRGIALQKIKKHRTAVKIYSKIPQQSKYYPAARLNIATAYIRQDWWTDAHTKINEILTSKKIKTNSEMINRLYLVLGYSLLRKEFYRDSREAFRNIEIDSIYFNKALLGIALTATNQEDYISALNAINILKSKKTFDLSVDESHLLLPYTYEKLKQNMTASASYTDAQKYYQQRIKNITSIKNKKQYNVNAEDILNNNNYLNVDNNIINFSNHYPVSFLENSSQLNMLSKYTGYIKNKKLLNQYNSLKTKHNNSLSIMISDIFDERLTYLNSYMNQSKFGLARLFDNSNI